MTCSIGRRSSPSWLSSSRGWVCLTVSSENLFRAASTRNSRKERHERRTITGQELSAWNRTKWTSARENRPSWCCSRLGLLARRRHRAAERLRDKLRAPLRSSRDDLRAQNARLRDAALSPARPERGGSDHHRSWAVRGWQDAGLYARGRKGAASRRSRQRACAALAAVTAGAAGGSAAGLSAVVRHQRTGSWPFPTMNAPWR